MPAIKNITGQRFGRLTVIKFVDLRVQARWLCRCACGNEIITTGGSLRSGNTRSCGCLHRESIQQTNRARSTHGMFGTPEYRSWSAMMSRCTNPSVKAFERYGKRGIGVCVEWRTFDQFYSDMGPRPAGASLDRIDNDKGYSPDNCRWATRSEQQRNRRDNRYITHNGERRIVSDWAKAVGISPHTIYARLERGWSVDDALTKPLRHGTKPRRPRLRRTPVGATCPP